MDSKVVLAGLSPHPPIIVPEVGRGEEKGALSTAKAMEEMAEAFASAEYDTLVVITPHGAVFRDAVSIRGGAELKGDFGGFGAARARLCFSNDTELVREICAQARRGAEIATVLLDRRTMDQYMAEERLDHGVLVPLNFMAKKGFRKPVVVINIAMLPMLDLYRYGTAIARAAESVKRRIAVLASGDLSHRLLPGAPGGYNAKGQEFDKKLIGYLRDFDPAAIVNFPEDLAAEAGECGLRPIVMMLGALDGVQVKSNVLSYEGPFGVGYGVALFTPSGPLEAARSRDIERACRQRLAEIREGESFAVKLARETVENYVRTRKSAPAPERVPAAFIKPAGVFVSIHKQGVLRGCIGTTGPSCPTAAEEIIRNAVSAAADDPRFPEVTLKELPFLDYSVDILSEPEEAKSEADLDPKTYGVIVEKDGRRGLLLPDLAGVDTVEEQLEIAKRKAGIALSETGVRLRRFVVTRYH